MTRPAPDASARAALVAGAAEAKLADDVVVLDVGDIISITERFVIASAGNTRQVRTIVEEIEAVMKRETADGPRAVEGLPDATWVLMDFGDVIAHVFLAETRAFYDLDRLWADAPVEYRGVAAPRLAATDAV